MNTNESKEEMIFTHKERDCQECDKEKEIEVSFGLSTLKEWDTIIPMLDRYNLTRQEIQYIYGFYNREFKEKKVPGCGKCFVNIARNLKNRYKRLKSELEQQ